jgi:hypothetical protein
VRHGRERQYGPTDREEDHSPRGLCGAVRASAARSQRAGTPTAQVLPAPSIRRTPSSSGSAMNKRC